MTTQIDPNHRKPRTVLRILGPILIVVGISLVIFSAIKMFGGVIRDDDPMAGLMGGRHTFNEAWQTSHRHFNDSARSGFAAFGMGALGLICTFAGIAMTVYGNMGRIARYASAEIAPVAKDTFNYVADGTQGGVRTIAGAIGEGLAGNMAAAPRRQSILCHKCNASNDAGSKFCDQCGAAMVKNAPCPDCGELNDGDAKFCNNCGRPLQKAGT